MNGKIFPESSNIYQDQAKILFNYYQSMAEKIVQEEERIEKEIAKFEEEKKMIEDILSSFWNRIKLWFQGKLKKTRLQVETLNTRISEFQKMHKEIFRDYKVSKLGVAYVHIADQIKYENKSFIVDHTGMVEESEVKLQLSKQNDLLIETISELEKLSGEAPIVESSNEIEEIETEHYSKSMQQLNQHDYFGKLERSLRTISYCMDDLDVTSVQLPLVANESSYLNFLKEFATNEVPENTPIFKAFDTQKYNEQISKFQELNKLNDSLSRHTEQFEDVLKGLMETMANSVQAISALKVASTDKIVFESNKVLYKILKSPYNHYSPILEASEIERIRNESFNYSEAVSDYIPFQLKDSSKVSFNLVSGMWTAGDGSTTNFPFGVHQIHEEIVAPMVQNLMNETRIERLKIYNHIKDQKISYLNKWHQDTEDFYERNRAESADLINLMRASLRDYVAAYNTLTSLKKTEDSMAQSDGSLDSTVVTATENSAEVFAAFELQSKEFQNVQLDFENYMERLKEDIDMKAQKFEHIDYYDALLRDGTSKEIAVAADEVHSFDARRKPLITVNPLFAKTSHLPPTPSVEDITFEHMSLNLPNIARITLKELDDDLVVEHPVAEDNDEIEKSNIESDGDIVENQISEIDGSDEELGINQADEENSESNDEEENIVESDENERDENSSNEVERYDSESENEEPVSDDSDLDERGVPKRKISMILEMKIPSPGESITEVEIAQWLVESGDYVEKDQAIAEIDSDKATLELPAEASGAIELLAEEGDTVEVGQIVCKIDTSVKGSLKAAPKEEKQEVKKEEAPAKAEAKSIETAAKKEETKTEEKQITAEKIDTSNIKASIVKMPKLSDTMTDGVVAKWHKKIGEKVASGELLAEIETDKATMEFESFEDGVLLYIGVQEGGSAPVDSVLAIIGEKGADFETLLKANAKGDASELKEEKVFEKLVSGQNELDEDFSDEDENDDSESENEDIEDEDDEENKKK